MTDWTHIRNINTRRFDVELSYAYDDYAHPGDFDGETWALINEGKCNVYVFRVRLYLDGVQLASEYLGGSVYEDPAEFAREHLGSRGSYYPDMVRAACKEARSRINNAPRVRAVA